MGDNVFHVDRSHDKVNWTSRESDIQCGSKEYFRSFNVWIVETASNC